MSIKRKVVIANLIMLILIAAFMFLFLFFTLRIFVNSYLEPDPIDIYAKNDGDVSLSEFKVVIDDIQSEVIDTNGNIESGKNYREILGFLKKTKSTLCLIKNNELIYVSDKAFESSAMNFIGGYAGDALDAEYNAFYSDKDAMLIRSTVSLKDDSEISVFLINKNDVKSPETGRTLDVFSGFENRRTQRILWVVGIMGVLVISIVFIALIWGVSRSITVPLSKLKEATKRISEGDFDTEIETVEGDGEIKEVIESFNYMERKLKESDEQKQKYENSRKELIAGISHDLKTPITSIKGYVSGLMDGVADTPEKQSKYLRTILNTADDMDTLVDDLFLLSKLDLDRIPFEFERTDIGAYLEDCAEEMKFAFEKDMLAVSFNNRLSQPVFVFMDKNRFGRVLINIARNSVKYKRGELGSLHIDLSVPEDNPKFARIVLKDNGMGVGSESLGKIFDSFYRTDKSRTNPGSGSGLGLSIAKQIVVRHHGKIYAESIIGQGLSIIIELPFEGEFENEKNSDS